MRNRIISGIAAMAVTAGLIISPKAMACECQQTYEEKAKEAAEQLQNSFMASILFALVTGDITTIVDQPDDAADGLLHNVQVSLGHSEADINDRLIGGDGDSWESVLTISADIGEAFSGVLATGVANREIDSNDLEANTDFIQGALIYHANDRLSFGPFMGYSKTDVDFGTLGVPGTDPDRWSVGVLAMTSVDLMGQEFGLTTALGSLNIGRFPTRSYTLIFSPRMPGKCQRYSSPNNQKPTATVG